MSQQRVKWLAWLLWVVAIALAVAGTVVLALTVSTPTPATGPFRGWPAILAVSSSTVGALIVLRGDGNAVGWLLLSLGLVAGAEHASREYSYAAILEWSDSLPGGVLAATIFQQIGILEFMSVVFLLLLFPTGRVLSARWRPIFWLAAAALVLAVVGQLFLPGPMTEFSSLSNPIGLRGSAGRIMEGIGSFGLLLASASLLVGAYSLVPRFKRSSGVERQQLKWFIYSVGFLALGFAGFLVGGLIAYGGRFFSAVLDVWYVKAFVQLVFIGFALLPVAVGIAILRYRLFDIDRIISRTLSYAIVTAVLGGVFAVVVLVPVLIVGSGDAPDYLIAAATVAVAALFRPVRRRVQAAVDRRFNRARYDAAQTIAGFAARLREDVDIDSLRSDLTEIVDRTMHPAHVTLWLRSQS